MDRLELEEIVECGKYYFILDWNYCDLKDTLDKFTNNYNEKIFYAAIQYENYENDELCMGLTLKDIVKLREHIDKMIEKLS
jgi:hypothetical protein